jgi:hypothetical protein
MAGFILYVLDYFEDKFDLVVGTTMGLTVVQDARPAAGSNPLPDVAATVAG